MAKTNRQINKEAGMTPNIEDSPAVLAYRMGQNEVATKDLTQVVRDGFEKHDKKLDALTANFASKEELMVVQRQLDNYKWFLRALTAAVLTALAGAVVALATRSK